MDGGDDSTQALPLPACCSAPLQVFRTIVKQLTVIYGREGYHYHHLCERNSRRLDGNVRKRTGGEQNNMTEI
jgi:hypothetical protein